MGAFFDRVDFVLNVKHVIFIGMKKPFHLLVSLCIVAVLLGAIGVLALSWRNWIPPENSTTRVNPFMINTPQGQSDLNDRIRGIGRQCLLLSPTAPIQYKEIGLNPTILALSSYHFFLVWGHGIATRPCLVAVSPDGEVLQMPAEFGKIIQKEGIVVRSQIDARNLVTTYVTLTTPLGKVLVLSGLEMIPGLDRNPLQKPLEIAISPPTIKSLGSDYSVRLFTWKELGGVIEEWSITVSENGILHVQSKQLASHVGEAVGLQ